MTLTKRLCNFARRVCGAALVASLFAGVVAVAPAAADDLIVKYDQSKLIRLPRPAAEVIIGNASIADVSVRRGGLLVVTGKSFGITNIIALDGERNVIQDQRIIVQRDIVSTVNVQLGSERRSFNCSPQCNPSITVGDDKDWLEKVAGMTLSKLKIADAGQSGTAGGR